MEKMETITAKKLYTMKLPPSSFVVDGLLPKGLHIFAGPPKVGKSRLLLQLALAVASGNKFLGLDTEQGTVLSLCLEDNLSRLQKRVSALTDDPPDTLHLATIAGSLAGGLCDQLVNFLEEHDGTNLIIIDTLQKVRDSKGSAGKAGMYGNDYDDISSIKRIADGFNIAILLVHHLRKLQDSDDPFNDVSGSTGIIGAADTNFILRRKRSGNAATLLVSGRDVEYQELTLQFNDLVWELVERKNSEDIHKAEFTRRSCRNFCFGWLTLWSAAPNG